MEKAPGILGIWGNFLPARKQVYLLLADISSLKSAFLTSLFCCLRDLVRGIISAIQNLGGKGEEDQSEWKEIAGNVWSSFLCKALPALVLGQTDEGIIHSILESPKEGNYIPLSTLFPMHGPSRSELFCLVLHKNVLYCDILQVSSVPFT